MDDKPIPEEPELVQCDICMKEIPPSVANSHEGDEYVHHFCGLECYDKWRKDKKKAAKKPPSAKR